LVNLVKNQHPKAVMRLWMRGCKTRWIGIWQHNPHMIAQNKVLVGETAGRGSKAAFRNRRIS